MTQWRMEIDLSKCTGCGACALACKAGNNTPWRSSDQSFNWADFLFNTTGRFPNTWWQATPVNCNHCANPACVAVCPVPPDAQGRKAVYKIPAGQPGAGIVVNNSDRCIGCRSCQQACPFSALSMTAPISQNGTTGRPQFSVISFNAETPHQFWNGTEAVIAGGTATPREVRTAAGGNAPPNRTRYLSGDLPGLSNIRRQGVVEKCHLCIHRILDSNLGPTAGEGARRPYCVLACPAGARRLLKPGESPSPGARVLKPGSRLYPEFVKPDDPTAAWLSPQVYYKNWDKFSFRV